jgi:hypothetical protein
MITRIHPWKTAIYVRKFAFKSIFQVYTKLQELIYYIKHY